MTRKQELLAQIATLQAEVNTLNRAPEDTFNIGTVVRFVANNNTTKWHYLKVAEEEWQSMQSSDTTRELSSWIATALESSVGYFEVYALTVAASPIFTSS